MKTFEINGVLYWVPRGWDVAVFGGVLHRRSRRLDGPGWWLVPDQWVVVDDAAAKIV